MSSWVVVYTERSELDLRDIFEYIAFSLLEPGTATKQTRRILDGVAKLSMMPHRHPLYQNEPWRSRGLRVLPVDNFLVFYLPVESRNTVVIVRIMYGGRDSSMLLFQTE